MKSKLLFEGKERIFALVFDPDEEVISELTQFAKTHKLDAAQITAVGGFSSATLGYYDRQQQKYTDIPVNEQVEVLSLLGDIALDEKKEPKVHVHVVVGQQNGNTKGGHIQKAQVWPTLEVIINESPSYLQRKFNSSVGLALIDPEI